jgi:hypothetical protein
MLNPMNFWLYVSILNSKFSNAIVLTVTSSNFICSKTFCSKSHNFEVLFCQTSYKILNRQIFKLSTKFRTNYLDERCYNCYDLTPLCTIFMTPPLPYWAALTYLVTNIPLGAYLLRLGAHY